MNYLPDKFYSSWALVFVLAAFSSNAYALFEDDEARVAILELRTLRKNDQEKIRLLQESLLLLQSEITQNKQEVNEIRGGNERLLRGLDVLRQDLQQQQAQQGEWQRQYKPVLTSYDGLEVSLYPKEKDLYDAALLAYRENRYEQSLRLLQSYETLYPLSLLVSSIGFWQGNALFILERYQDAIDAYRKALSSDPDQFRAPDSMLGIANAQILLKKTKNAKATLKNLLEKYPQSEAAIAAQDRLKRLG